MKKEAETTEPTPKKPPRRMSSALQVMARIERHMEELERIEQDEVVAWFNAKFNRVRPGGELS